MVPRPDLPRSSLTIITRLEAHYAEFDGLNLTWETLEGIAKHNGPVKAPIHYALAEYVAIHDLELSTCASAEAQVAMLARSPLGPVVKAVNGV